MFQGRSAQELRSWRFKSGMTKDEAHQIEVARGSRAHPAAVGEIQLLFNDGRPSIFRMADEPGIWRLHSTCEPLPYAGLLALVGEGQIAEELAQRRTLDDQETAKEVLASVLRSSGATQEVERRGSYVLVQRGEQFDVQRDGVALLPSPAAEHLARAVFDALAPAIMTKPDTSLAAELGA